MIDESHNMYEGSIYARSIENKATRSRIARKTFMHNQSTSFIVHRNEYKFVFGFPLCFRGLAIIVVHVSYCKLVIEVSIHIDTFEELTFLDIPSVHVPLPGSGTPLHAYWTSPTPPKCPTASARTRVRPETCPCPCAPGTNSSATQNCHRALMTP